MTARREIERGDVTTTVTAAIPSKIGPFLCSPRDLRGAGEPPADEDRDREQDAVDDLDADQEGDHGQAGDHGHDGADQDERRQDADEIGASLGAAGESLLEAEGLGDHVAGGAGRIAAASRLAPARPTANRISA